MTCAPPRCLCLTTTSGWRTILEGRPTWGTPRSGTAWQPWKRRWAPPGVGLWLGRAGAEAAAGTTREGTTSRGATAVAAEVVGTEARPVGAASATVAVAVDTTTATRRRRRRRAGLGLPRTGVETVTATATGTGSVITTVSATAGAAAAAAGSTGRTAGAAAGSGDEWAWVSRRVVQGGWAPCALSAAFTGGGEASKHRWGASLFAPPLCYCCIRRGGAPWRTRQDRDEAR